MVVIKIPVSNKWRAVNAALFAVIGFSFLKFINPDFSEFKKVHNPSGPANYDINFAEHAREFAIQIGFGIIFTLLHMYAKKMLMSFANQFVAKKKKWSVAVRKTRMERWCASVFKMVYFCCITAFAYRMLKDQDFMPKSLGGSGDLYNMHRGFLVEVNDNVIWYYRIASGYHWSELIFQLLFEWVFTSFTILDLKFSNSILRQTYLIK